MSEDKEEKSVLIMAEGKYGIIMSGRNWIVAELVDASRRQNLPKFEDFSRSGYTYHANIQQAIIEVADRMTKERLTAAAKQRALKVEELIEIMREKDQWMRKAILGRV